MKVYAERTGYRSRQIVGDLLVVAWVVLWVRVGMLLHDLVARLAEPGERVEEAGQRFAAGLEGVASRVQDVPVVGGALEAPFRGVAGAGRTLEAAGQAQQEVVMTLALWLGVLTALFPILAVGVVWLVVRLRWSWEATVAARLRDESADLRVFALRAVSNRSLRMLRRTVRDPGAALARQQYAPLAALELHALGLEVERGGGRSG